MSGDENRQAAAPDEQRRVTLGAEALQALAEEVIASGALGRSKVYAALLRYLVDCANQGRNPKEIEVAIEVLGRTTDFDVGKDSAVRVYIHQLRKKLDQHYARQSDPPTHRLLIPKGQYTAEVTERTLPAAPDPAAAVSQKSSAPASSSGPRSAGRRGHYWAMAATLLLAANLLYWAVSDRLPGVATGPAAAQHPAWAALLNDDVPLLVVMGDYYIFGELDEAGNVSRMIREFDVNSGQDLDYLFAEQPELGWRYYDLNMHYLPEGSAFALNSIAPLLHAAGKPVAVKMMSELTMRDVQRNHVVYIGNVSNLDRLGNMLFSISGLALGENFDQLVNKQSDVRYTSDAGLPSFDRPFVDYGWFATFPSTPRTQVIVVAGMRDAGLVHVSRAVTDLSTLQALDEQLAGNGQRPLAYEALFQVRGLDRMNFDARLAYASPLNAGHIWWDDRAARDRP